MYGLLAGLLWAFDTVILSYGMDKIGLNLFIIPLIVTAIHDLISFLFLIVSIAKSVLIDIKNHPKLVWVKMQILY
mgnify:CR=1 FL=1